METGVSFQHTFGYLRYNWYYIYKEMERKKTGFGTYIEGGISLSKNLIPVQNAWNVLNV